LGPAQLTAEPLGDVVGPAREPETSVPPALAQAAKGAAEQEIACTFERQLLAQGAVEQERFPEFPPARSSLSVVETQCSASRVASWATTDALHEAPTGK
jgi:hypothetical protein